MGIDSLINDHFDKFPPLTVTEFIEESQAPNNQIVQITSTYSSNDLQNLAKLSVGNVKFVVNNNGETYALQYTDENSFSQTGNTIQIENIGKLPGDFTVIHFVKGVEDVSLSLLNSTTSELNHLVITTNSFWHLNKNQELIDLIDTCSIDDNPQYLFLNHVGIDVLIEWVNQRDEELREMFDSQDVFINKIRTIVNVLNEIEDPLGKIEELSSELKIYLVSYYHITSRAKVNEIIEEILHKKVIGELEPLLKGREDETMEVIRRIRKAIPKEEVLANINEFLNSYKNSSTYKANIPDLLADVIFEFDRSKRDLEQYRHLNPEAAELFGQMFVFELNEIIDSLGEDAIYHAEERIFKEKLKELLRKNSANGFLKPLNNEQIVDQLKLIN
jgi:hypothetical protein